MTTNDATARDAIAIEISEVAKADSDLHYATSGSMFLDNPEECAEAVIAHLWQAADDPEVVREVASALSQIPFTVLDPRITARTAAAALLAELLGPRPGVTP